MKKFFLLALLLANSLYALEVGEIAMLRGEALVARQGNDLKAKIQMPIEDKDTIKTKEESKVQISFKDETVITIGAETIFEIEDYLYEEKNSKANFNVNKGSFKVITGKIGKLAPKSFLLKTKTSLIGIRGTIFAGEIGQDEANGDFIACIKGSIVVTSLTTKESFEITHGQMIFIGDDGSLGKPEKLNKEQFIAFSHLEKISTTTQAPKTKISSADKLINPPSTQNTSANEEKSTQKEQELSQHTPTTPSPSIKEDIQTLISQKATATYKGSLKGVSKGEYTTPASTVKLKSNLEADMDMQVDFGNNDPLKLKISNQKLTITEANVNGEDVVDTNLQELNHQVQTSNSMTANMMMEKEIDADDLKMSAKYEKTVNDLTTKAKLEGKFKDNYASGITGTLKESTKGQTNGIELDRQIDTTFDVNKK